MRFPLLIILISTLFFTSCGGGGGDSKTNQPERTNTPPVIAPATAFTDNSADGIIQTLESFVILMKITDINNDVLTGSVKIDDDIVELSLYAGTEDFTHKAEFVIATKGEKTANIIVSDGKNTEVTSSYVVSIVPNNNEVQTILVAKIPNFILGGEFEESALLGSNTDENSRTIGYISTALTEANLQHNAAPAGECGVNTPHKLLNVDVTTTDVIVPEVGLTFPLECISESQNKKIEAKVKKQALSNLDNVTTNGYIAQSFVINDNSEEGISIVQTGSGIRIEGIVNDIICGEIVLSLDENVYKVSNEQITPALDSLFENNNSFILSCYRTIEYEGELQNSPLLATITGELTETDSTSPTGSIDSITFSIPYQNGGLDQGDICASTTANDNSGTLNELLTLHASDGLVDDVVMTYKESTSKYCASLSGFDGGVHVTQTITDIANNEVTNISETYPIEKNDAPVFSEDLAANIIVKTNQGIVTVINKEDVSDPENQEVTLAGKTTIDTALAAGNYNITATATDPYNAQTSKTIAVQLSDNLPPTAQMDLTVEYSMIGDAIRDINETVELTLSSEDQDGFVVDSKLETQMNSESYSEITNYSSKYTHNISTEGGDTRAFNYQVTDNAGFVSEVAHLEFDIHLNTPPIYQGKLSYTVKRGECITVEQKGADNENDKFSFEIQGDDWLVCSDHIETIDRLVTIKDDYGSAASITITADFTDCTDTEVWAGSECRILDTTPDTFTFSARKNVGFNTVYGSNIITITGIEAEIAVSITGGRYSINDFAVDESDLDKYTSANGIIQNGDRIHVVQTSSANEKTTTITRVTIGGVTGEFKVTTDSFAPEVSTGQDKHYTSSGQTISGVATIQSGIHNSLASFSWTQVSGPRSLGISQSEELDYGVYSYPINFTAPEVTEIEVYTFRFTATNGDGMSGYDEWKVTISPSSNIPPTANAGSNLTVTSGELVTLNGSASDSDGTIESYTWGQFTTTLAGGEPTSTLAVTFDDRNSPIASFTAPEVTEEHTIMLHLHVTDNEGLENELPELGTTPASVSGDDIVYITIKPRSCPAGTVWDGNACQTEDIAPDPFSFTSFSIPGGSGPSYYYSQFITISGINTEVDISVENGWYEINSNGGYTSQSGKVKNADVIKVRVDMNDAGDYLTLTVGSYSAQFLIYEYGV